MFIVLELPEDVNEQETERVAGELWDILDDMGYEGTGIGTANDVTVNDAPEVSQ